LAITVIVYPISTKLRFTWIYLEVAVIAVDRFSADDAPFMILRKTVKITIAGMPSLYIFLEYLAPLPN